MSHCDPELLALRSLGESVGTPEEQQHLATCQVCQAELSSLSTLVGAARSGGPLEIQSPSPQVWTRIRAELGLPAGSPVEAPQPPVVAVDSPPDVEAAVTPDAAPVVSLEQRRDRRARRTRPATWLLAAAGVGGIVVGGAVTAAVLGADPQPELTVAATVPLAPLPSWDASGTAELAVDADGRQVLVVSLDATAAADADGFQEVWLIDENVEGMVSLGVLEGSSGQFVVPAGVDVGQFPIVDVSLEPFDGDPTHSGDSIARGQIEA